MSLVNKKIKKSILTKIINSIFVCGGGCNTEHVTIPTLIRNSGNLIKNEMNLKEMKIRTNVPINFINVK